MGPGVAERDANEDVVLRGLGVVGCDLPIPVAVEDSGVEQLVLWHGAASPSILSHQVVVGKRSLWVQVAPSHPRMRRCGVEVEPVLLGVLAVIAVVPGQPEDALLEDRIAAVPESKREAQDLAVVGQTSE